MPYFNPFRSYSCDPIKWARVCWPNGFSQITVPYQYKNPRTNKLTNKVPYWFYEKQREVIYSVEYNVETIVPAGNQLGKDFVAGFIGLKQFITNPIARVIPTSVKDEHLRVVWSEILNFINTSVVPLRAEDGGVLIVPKSSDHRYIRKLTPDRQRICDKSYLWAMVSERGEGIAGHHAPYALIIGDEASGIDDQVYKQSRTWRKRGLWFGNCGVPGVPCNNFFRDMVDEGDILETQITREMIDAINREQDVIV